MPAAEKNKKTENRNNSKHKDSVFRFIFSVPEHALEVAKFFMHNPDLTVDDIKVINTHVILDYKFRNDVVILCQNKLLIMLEHQSTLNENMPLRYLFYVSDYFRSILASKKLYEETLIELPEPEFIVFYNGKKKTKASWEQKFSQAFGNAKKKTFALELRVKWFNVRLASRSKILRASKALKAYSAFAEQVEIEYAATGDIDLAISRAWEYCIKKKLLGEFFEKNRQEVSNMFTEEWNEEYALEAREAKGRREGEAKGLLKNVKALMETMHLTVVQAMDALKISQVERRAVLAALN